MQQITFKVSGMTCNHCAMTIKNELTDAGYKVVSVDSASGLLVLEIAEGIAGETVLQELLPLFKELEYGISL